MGLVGAQQYSSSNVHPRGETYTGSRQYSNQLSSVQQQHQHVHNPYQNQQPQYYQQSNYQQGVNRVQSQNYQSPQRPQQQISNRLSEMQGDDGNRYPSDLTTRTPPKKVVQTTDLPQPQDLNIRFDNIKNRTIRWDGELSRNAEEFSLTLLAYIESLYQNQNFMISPFSIHSLLVMIAEGASGNTFEELRKALGLESQQRARDFHQYISTALKYI